MVQYDNYKDSGINWIGEIPAEWRESRIGNIYDARNEKVSELDYAPLSVTMNGIVPQLETAAKTQDQDNRKLVKAGDFAINSRSDRRGSCGIAPCDGSVSLITNVLRPRRNVKMFDEYFEWLFHSEGFTDEYYKNGTGIVDDLWSTNWSRMKKIAIPIPPIEDQKAISSYLNNRVGFTDSLIEKTTSSIDLLHEYRESIITEAVTHGLKTSESMKPSGVEWIEQIPESWQVNSIRGVTSLITNGFVGPTRDLFHSSGVRYIQSLHIVDGKLNFDKHPYYVSEKWSGSHARSVLKEGDVLVVQTGAIGNCAYVAREYEGCNCHALIILRPDEKEMTGKYLYYYLTGHVGREKMLITRTGTTHPHLNSTKVQFVQVLIPPICEQDEIVEFLDTKTAEIDALIASKTRQVELLREYRKSIISEAVTGKFKVPGLE